MGVPMLSNPYFQLHDNTGPMHFESGLVNSWITSYSENLKEGGD